MNVASKLAVLTLAATLTGGIAGCEKSRDEMRPDMDTVVSGEHGPQCRDLREMATLMAPKLIACPDIVSSPYKVTIVVKHMDNQTEDMPGRNMDIYVAKLAGNLSTAAATDRIQFVEEAATLRNMQAQELGNPDPFEEGSRTGQPSDPRLKPQYFLYGTVFSMNNGRTSYYLFKFKMTNSATGAIAWSGDYDVRTLN